MVGPEAYGNNEFVDLPACEMIKRHSKVKLAKNTEHTLKVPKGKSSNQLTCRKSSYTNQH
jgi:hypothetical protein